MNGMTEDGNGAGFPWEDEWEMGSDQPTFSRPAHYQAFSSAGIIGTKKDGHPRQPSKNDQRKWAKFSMINQGETTPIIYNTLINTESVG